MNPYDHVPVPTLGDVMRDHAAIRPDAVAIRSGNRAWTYRELNSAANRVAASLLRDGHVAGDRIGYVGKNSDAIALLALGASRAGIIFVPVNWRLAPLEVRHILRDAGVRTIFFNDDDGPPGPDVEAVIRPASALHGDWLSADDSPGGSAVRSVDTAVMIYTSGTTGMPKGVMLSHRSLLGTSTLRRSAVIAWDDWGPDDVTLVPIPLAHIGGLGMLVRTLFYGGEAIIQSGFDAGDVLSAIRDQRVSKIGLVPTAMKMVLDHPRSRGIDYSRIRTIIYGAAPITLDLLREAIGVFGCQFAQSYGMSETSGTCVALPPGDHDVNGTPRMRSAGTALPGTELRIVDEDGAVLPTGTTGEIAIRTISMMSGYWHMPDATARVLDDDGWYRTGDAGYLDADGYLFIKDRVKDMIVSGAENVYPAEVENALAGHPDIAEVAVIGVPDPLWGEAVKAIVVPVAGHTVDPQSVIAWARDRIAGYKAPRSVDVVTSLPCNATGKVQKTLLRQRYWGECERQVN